MLSITLVSSSIFMSCRCFQAVDRSPTSLRMPFGSTRVDQFLLGDLQCFLLRFTTAHKPTALYPIAVLKRRYYTTKTRAQRSHAGIRIMSDLKWAGGCESDYFRAKKSGGVSWICTAYPQHRASQVHLFSLAETGQWQSVTPGTHGMLGLTLLNNASMKMNPEVNVMMTTIYLRLWMLCAALRVMTRL